MTHIQRISSTVDIIKIFSLTTDKWMHKNIHEKFGEIETNTIMPLWRFATHNNNNHHHRDDDEKKKHSDDGRVSHYSNCLQMNEIRFHKNRIVHLYWRSYRIDLKHVKSHAGIFFSSSHRWLTTKKWQNGRKRKKQSERNRKKKNRFRSIKSHT